MDEFIKLLDPAYELIEGVKILVSMESKSF